jgi:flagellar basal-body rod protein FlgC
MSLFAALSVSASGMTAQRTRAELLVENLANAETTRTPEGGPYRRKDAVFESTSVGSPFSSVLFQQIGGPGEDESTNGVSVADIVTDTRDPERRYLPGHPDADAEGYVAFPRMNPAEDMVDLMSASRGYEANVAAIGAVKDMIQHSIDLLR